MKTLLLSTIFSFVILLSNAQTTTTATNGTIKIEYVEYNVSAGAYVIKITNLSDCNVSSEINWASNNFSETFIIPAFATVTKSIVSDYSPSHLIKVKAMITCTNENKGWLVLNVPTVILPITLKSFDAKIHNKQVILSFDAEMDCISEHMIIERSTGSNDWIRLGVITGTTVKTFTDATPYNGTNLYRLLLVGNDKTSYSKTISVSISNSNQTTVYRSNGVMIGTYNESVQNLMLRLPNGHYIINDGSTTKQYIKVK